MQTRCSVHANKTETAMARTFNNQKNQYLEWKISRDIKLYTNWFSFH